MTRLRVIDIETTGIQPPAEIIEIGSVDLILSHEIHVEAPRSQLYRPLGQIPPEVMAVHHLTEADLGPNLPVGTESELWRFLFAGPAPDVFVAHNCDFERAFISSTVTGSTPWICTHKAALCAWPDAPKHSNQVLRYWLGLRLDPALAMPPHRAAPDAYVTAQILARLLAVAPAETLVVWTQEPRRIPRLTFGKHRGTVWSDVPADYLEWMTKQLDMDGDVRWCADQELRRRRSTAPIL